MTGWRGCAARTSSSAPINTLLEASNDPDVVANGYVTEMAYPKHGKTLKVHGTPWQFSETPARIGIAPELGADNAEVLGGLATARSRSRSAGAEDHLNALSLRGAQRRSNPGRVVRAQFDRDCRVAPLLAMTMGGPLRAPSGVLRGILLMCAGVSVFPFMNVAVKLLAVRYPAAQITWARFTGHLIVMLIIFLPQYRWGLFRTRRPAVQIGRSVLMLVSNLVFVMAIGAVPLATASAIGFTSPLLVTALSVPLLREQVGWRRWSAVVVGFAGALMVIRPASGFRDPAVLLLLFSSFAYALYQIATRLVGRYDNAATGIIFAALLGSLGMSLVMPFIFVMPRSLLDALLFCSLGLLGGFGHYLVIRAFQLGPAAVIAPLGYVELLGTVVLGYLVFDNFPDLWTWLGAGVIIASGIYIAFRERRRREAR